MICNKCSGFAIWEPFFEFIGSRCMNCGKRFWDSLPSIDITDFERFIIQQRNETQFMTPERVLTEIKVCKVCAQQFMPNKTNRVYCSYTCRKRSRHIQKEETQSRCKLCNKSFIHIYSNREFCSKVCLWKFGSNTRKLKRGF